MMNLLIIEFLFGKMILQVYEINVLKNNKKIKKIKIYYRSCMNINILTLNKDKNKLET